MATFVVTAENKGLVSGKDARHVTVRVNRDEEYLGKFQTWVSGIDLMTVQRGEIPVTVGQFWRLVANELAQEIRVRASSQQLRSTWSRY